MSLLTVLMLVCFLFKPLTFQAIYQPRPDQCLRKRGDVWWDRYDYTFEKKCEINPADGEECGVCGRPCFSCYRKTTIYPACWHKGMGWKFDIIKPEGAEHQLCLNMDHCSLSYLLKDQSQLEKVCGKGNGTQEPRGECKSVYGSYVCECKKPYQGRDCNDIGPAGSYATGVKVLLDTKARVSNWLTVLVAVKTQGNYFKVYVNTLQFNTTIILTDPLIDDPTSAKIVKYCKAKTNLGSQCTTFLKGSTFVYSVDLWFPVRRDFSVWYYEDKDTKTHHPIGYNTTLTITTTNSVNGVEKESFFRTHYDRNYIVFVEYPMYITCYANVKIVNCEEVQEIGENYDASKDIVLTGDLPTIKFNEPVSKDKIRCNNDSYDAMKWKLNQIMPDGKFRYVAEFNVKDDIRFVIKPYSLRQGMFRIDFIYKMVTYKGNRENFDQCFFTVVEAPLIAIISDGTGRYVDVDTAIVLDGRESYDPNVDELSNKVGLNFEWSCVLNQTGKACLETYIAPQLGSRDYIKLPPSILEPGKAYMIRLIVRKKGKTSAVASQTLFTGRVRKILSVGMKCVNCMEGNVANPTELIYLLVNVVIRGTNETASSLKYNWTFSTYPEYPPVGSIESIRVNGTSEYLLKVDKMKLEENTTYSFRAAVQEDQVMFAEMDIRIPISNNFSCNILQDSGTVAVTDFILNCTKAQGHTYEVFDKLSIDPNYFTGRMLFTGFDPRDNDFKLANQKVVVYSFNKYKMIQEWVHDIKLTPFDGHIKDINDMVINLENFKIFPQRLLHSASVIPGGLRPDIDWSPINLLNRLISIVHNVKLKTIQDTKLVLSSLEFILVAMLKNNDKKEITFEVDEAQMCAEIIFALSSSLFEHVKKFNVQRTLTETILQQMIESHIKVIEIVLFLKNSKTLSKPNYSINPYTLHSVKETTFLIVDSLYKLSRCLLWRQINGDSATEIVVTGSQIREWVIVHPPDVLYDLRRQNQSIQFNFSFGFYQTLKNLDVLGIQMTNLNVNPYWWAGGDINTNILLVDICFKVGPTECKHQRTFYKAPIFLYFNISQTYSLIKPLEIHTVYLNLSNDPRDSDLDITVYRFDPPLRSKLFIKFEFNNSTENYRVLFCKNVRPDFEMMQKKGFIINNGNQSNIKYLNYARDDSDKLYYMGIFPVHEGKAGKRVQFKLKIVYAVCKTWLKWRWGKQRCWVGDQETDERTLRCDCNHLSMFAGSVQVPSYTLNPAIEFLLFLTEEYNLLPLIVLISILLVFILLFFWGWRKDRKDLIKGIVTVLHDNYPGERFAYLVGVYTGSRMNSSTDSNVGIKLFGVNNISRAHILKNSNHTTLRGNSDDWFLLYTPEHLGTLESLHIWHDNSGKSPDWFIEKIEVYDLTDKLQYIFELNIWLAFGLNEYPDAVVATSSIEDFCSFRQVFLSNVITGFRDTHYWSSIFWKHARNPVKRVYRIVTVLCYIMVVIICTVIYYNFNKGEDYEEDEPLYDLNYTDFYVFIISLLVASLTACLIMFLFRKSFSRKYVKLKSSVFIRPEVASERNIKIHSSHRKKDTSRIRMSKDLARLRTTSLYDSTKPRYLKLSSKNLDDKSISLGLRGKVPSERSTYEKFATAVHAIIRGSPLEPVRLQKYKSSLVLHKNYFIIAWILFIVIIILAVIIVILFGHRIPTVEGEKWFTVFLCVLLFDALILSTLKILVCSLILGGVFQRLVPLSNYQINPEDGMQKNLVGNIKHLQTLAQIRSHSMYCPLNDNLKELMRQKCVRREQWKTLVNFCVTLLFVLVLAMLTSLLTVSLYSSNAHASWMLTKGPSINYKHFSNIYNRTIFEDFLVHNFIYQLHRYLWYNQKHPIDNYKRSKSWTYDCTMRLLGNAQIRQLRVTLGECPDVKYFPDMGEYCSPPWSATAEDTGTYGVRWLIGGNEDTRRKTTAWRYTDESLSNSSESYGTTLTKYPSGGYIDNFGHEIDDADGALANLLPQRWLDHMTRAVFVELTLYNVNTRLLTQVLLVAEHMPSGEYLVAVQAESVTTDFTFDVWKIGFSVFFIFFLVRMCILMNRSGIFVYFSKIINVFEGFLLALGFLTIYLYLTHITSSSNYVQEFQRSGIDTFFNFSNLISFTYWSQTALCILLLCTVMRMLISFRFGRIYFTFYYTFLLSMPLVVWLILYLTLYLAVLRRFVGYLINIAVIYHSTSVIIYHKESASEASDYISHKVLVYLMCFLSIVVILSIVASFTYYYKVAKSHRLIDTDSFNLTIFVKKIIRKCCKLKDNQIYGSCQ